MGTPDFWYNCVYRHLVPLLLFFVISDAVFALLCVLTGRLFTPGSLIYALVMAAALMIQKITDLIAFQVLFVQL